MKRQTKDTITGLSLAAFLFLVIFGVTFMTLDSPMGECLMPGVRCIKIIP